MYVPEPGTLARMSDAWDHLEEVGLAPLAKKRTYANTPPRLVWAPEGARSPITRDTVLFIVAVTDTDDDGDRLAYAISPRSMGWIWDRVERERMLNRL